MPKQKPPSQRVNFAASKPTADQFLAASAELNRTSTDFLKVDLETALTFSGIALQSNNDEGKRRRNRINARRGYDMILHLARKVSLSQDDAEVMSHKLKRLKSELQSLGETF
jgi:hypothetical protein